LELNEPKSLSKDHFPMLRELGFLEEDGDDQPRARRLMANGKDIILLSYHQCQFIESFLESNSVRLACQDTSIEMAAVELWVQNEKFRLYVQELQDQKARADMLTATFVKAEFHKILSGDKKPGRTEGRLYEVAYRDLCSSLGQLMEGGAEWTFTAKSPPQVDDKTKQEAIDAETA